MSALAVAHRVDTYLDKASGSHGWLCACGAASRPVFPLHAAQHAGELHELAEVGRPVVAAVIDGEVVDEAPGPDELMAELEPSDRTTGPNRTVALLRGRIAEFMTSPAPGGDVEAIEEDELFWEGIPENTREAYRRQWHRFEKWAKLNDDPEVLPASVSTVVKYLRAHWDMRYPKDHPDKQRAGKKRGVKGQPYAPDTVRLALTTISVVHEAAKHVSPAKDRQVTIRMRGYARKWKKAGYKANVAAALSADEIIAMVRKCDLATCAGLRDAVLMRLALDIGRRPSELLSLNWGDVRWKSADQMIVTPQFGKTNKDNDEAPDELAIEADEDLAPDVDLVVLFRELKELMAARGYTTGPIFMEVNSGQRRKDGGHTGKFTGARMTLRAFEVAVKRYAFAAGVDKDPVSGDYRHIVAYSFRVSFATLSEEADIPIQEAAIRGGWKPDSRIIFRYYRTGKKWGDRNPGVIIRRKARQMREERAAKAGETEER